MSSTVLELRTWAAAFATIASVGACAIAEPQSLHARDTEDTTATAPLPDPGSPSDDTSPAARCDLATKRYSFDPVADGGAIAHGACDACISRSCCEAAVKCFDDNPDCITLAACVDACDAVDIKAGFRSFQSQWRKDAGTTDASSDAAADAAIEAGTTDPTDAGAPDAKADAASPPVKTRAECVNACNAAHPTSAPTFTRFSECRHGTCAASCDP
jgi:hypothetical protein